jgi:hypothetical protein
MGLLTIEKSVFGYTRLCIPNYSIKTVLWEYILKSVRVSSGFTINTVELSRSIRALALDGQAKPFTDYIVGHIFDKLSNRDLIQFDEKYIKIMMFSCLFQSNVYIPVSETETNNGYVDVYLRRSPLLPEVKYEWIFEIKYIKASDAGDKAMETHRRDAQKQLQDYRNSFTMKDSRDLKKAVILFIGKNKYEIVES